MRTIAIPHSSFSFREYSLEDYPSQHTTKSEQSSKVTLQLLQKLIGETDQHLQAVQLAVEEGNTLERIVKGKPIQERVLRAVQMFRATVVNVETVLCTCYPSISKKYPELQKHLTETANAAQRLLAVVDSVDTFTPSAKELRKKRAKQTKVGVVRIVKHMAALKLLFKEELAAIKMQENVERPKKRVDQLRKNAKTANMEPILDGFRKKGWRVPECYEAETTDTTTDAGLELSELLLQSVQKDQDQLLPDNALLGVIRFPAIVRLKSKLPDVTIKSCLHPAVGYNLYMVFGAYLVVDHAIAIGINRSIMRFHGEKGIEVDVEKFDKLLPYVMNEFPDWKQKLTNLRPVLPVHASGMHYYSMMLPRNVVASNGMPIGDWQFLQQQNG